MRAVQGHSPNFADHKCIRSVPSWSASKARGCAVLAQTTQEERGDLPNNRELTYHFLGITRDGTGRLSSRFRHRPRQPG